MLKSRTRFWKLVFSEANPRSGCDRIAERDKTTAGVPWSKDMKQLEAFGRCFGLHLRKTTKRPSTYMRQNIAKKEGNREYSGITTSIGKLMENWNLEPNKYHKNQSFSRSNTSRYPKNEVLGIKSMYKPSRRDFFFSNQWYLVSGTRFLHAEFLSSIFFW